MPQDYLEWMGHLATLAKRDTQACLANMDFLDTRAILEKLDFLGHMDPQDKLDTQESQATVDCPECPETTACPVYLARTLTGFPERKDCSEFPGKMEDLGCRDFPE